MRRTIIVACVLALIAIGAWAQQSGPQPPASRKTVPKKASAKIKDRAMAEAKLVPAQTVPPVPATLMNSTPVKPTVTMEGGLLTIDAPNSTLSDVLSGIHKATGAAIEGASPNERVAVRLGPGNPRQVVAALLYGTPYDYVILGSQDRQDGVTRILLTRSSGTDASSGQTVQNAGAQQHTQMESPEDNPPDQGTSEDTTTVPGTRVGADQSAEPQPAQNQNQPKTPEQLFKELQQLEQKKPPQ